MKTKPSMAVWSLAALLGFVLLAGCGKKEEEQPAGAPTAAPAAAATPIDPATAASISGTVKLDGEAPKAAKIDMSQDPACKGTNTAENVVASGGHLANVFVYVTKSPFFAVTGADGKFEIKGLPPGDYTIAFVQEKLGEQDVKVTLAAKDSKTVDATFKP